MGTNKKEEVPLIVLVERFLGSKNKYRYNVVSGYVEYWCHECSQVKILDDYEINTLHANMAKKGMMLPIGTLRNFLKSSFAPKFNPFEDYFGSLTEWDGIDYIQQLSETVHTTNGELWSIGLRKWIVGMVACLLDDKVTNQTMIVLSGEQGIGKTTWLLNLVPAILLAYVYSGSIDPSQKDTLIFLTEKMLINLDELDALGKNQLGLLKHLITKDAVTLRRPYGSITENMPRRASFVSSVNFKEFLSDLTGNRRFLCFDVTHIDYHHTVPIEGVYSQALHLWKSGFQFWLDKSEIETLNKSNEQYRMKSIEEELLLAQFDPCNDVDATEQLSTTEILEIIFDKNRNQIHNGSLQRLGKLLTKYNFVKIKKAGRQLYLLKRKAFYISGYQPVYTAGSAN